MSSVSYEGGELALFVKARNWKNYFRSEIEAHIRGAVLEVGAGIGATTRVFEDLRVEQWVCLEPDAAMSAGLRRALSGRPRFEVIGGTVRDLESRQTFDTILYIDVLEHIGDDRAELALAASHLSPGGSLIVLAPAHPWLYTSFDKAIGHYRRYTAESLRRLTPPGLKLERLFYLDSAGMLASVANRLLLRRSLPTEGQILTWDRRIVPISKRLDTLLGRRFGRTVIAVWRWSG